MGGWVVPPVPLPVPRRPLLSPTFMILPLWTIVRLRRFWSSAYWMADRTRRSVPSELMGLMPNALLAGNRTCSQQRQNEEEG